MRDVHVRNIALYAAVSARTNAIFVESALNKISGEDFKDLRAANDWWRKARATFKDPE